MKRHVIVGNGVAAVGCVEGIRSADTESEIVILSEEPHAVYSRPLISYYLEDRTDLRKMRYRDADFYEKNGCRVLYGTKATAIDPGGKTVRTADGGAVPYDTLCVAAGSSPFIPPFDGLETVARPFTFLTRDDAVALKAATEERKKVLIVGAGLIGLKCAEGLRDRAGSITVCDLADRVLSSILDADSARAVQTHLENNGVRFYLHNSVSGFNGNQAVLQSGETVPFDVLVLAVGVRANTGLVKDAGGAVNRGIVVDERMRTSLADIFAAGDCAEGFDSALGANRVLAILPNAYLQGFTAGVNMAGGDAVFNNAIPMNAIGFFGLHLMTAGVYDGELYEETTPDGGKKLFIKDNLLKGFILIGEQATRRAGLYTSLIRERVPLDSIDFALMEKTATSAAFPADKRKEMFGGENHDDR